MHTNQFTGPESGDGDRIAALETFMVDGGWRTYVVVKVITADGVVGWGDATLGWKEASVVALIDDFAERYVVGMDPFAINELAFRLYQVEHNTGPVLWSVLAGIETALLDIVGKRLGQPVANLVGGRVRDRIKAYANGWYAVTSDTGRLREQAAQVLELGYRALKFDPFGAGGREISRAELRQAVAAAVAVRDVIGDDGDLLIECHGRFSTGMAIEAIRAMQECQPLFCEEPIPAHSVESQAWVTRAVESFGARVATGEHVYSRYGFRDLLTQRAAHVIQPDLVYSGGFLETKRIADMAEAYYVTIAPHCCDGIGRLAASLQLCATSPNALILETFADFDVPWRKEMVASGEPVLDEDGNLIIPTAPGWGYELDEAVLRAHATTRSGRLDMFTTGWEKGMSK